MPQIRLRLHTADFRGFDEAIEKRSDVEAAVRARSVVILAAEHGQRIASEVVQHERTQPVEPLAQVDRRTVRVHGDLTRGPDHTRSRSAVTRPARSSPSIPKP